MKRLAWICILTLALAGTARAAPGPFDGNWHGRLETSAGDACPSSYEMTVAVKESRFRGFVVRGDSRFSVSGAVTDDGTLDDLRAEGAFLFEFQGQASGSEIDGRWEASRDGAGDCLGSFALSRKRLPEQTTTIAPERAQALATNETQARAAATTKPGYFIQLASLRSSNAADEAWSDLQKGYPYHLGDMELTVQLVELGNRGVFYRVQTGPFPNRATAKDVCWQLKARKQDCVVIKR